eukprot:jgi/Mesvir1/10676/Mv13767-RA.2
MNPTPAPVQYPRLPNQVLRVNYPAGSFSPSATRQAQRKLGGAGFHASKGTAPAFALRVGFYLRLPDDFDCAQGGLLPGLYGGVETPVTSDGTPGDGKSFSTRFAWREGCVGEVSALLPIGFGNPCNLGASSSSPGISPCNCRPQGTLTRCGNFSIPIGRGSFKLTPGTWHRLEQEVIVNTVAPGGAVASDGVLRVWFDGCVVYEQNQLRYRSDRLTLVSGLWFSTFFGNSDPASATPRDTSIYFSSLQVLPATLEVSSNYAPAIARALPALPAASQCLSPLSDEEAERAYPVAWLKGFGDGITNVWGVRENSLVLRSEHEPGGDVLQIRYPAGSSSPAASNATGAPIGGAGFRAALTGTQRMDLFNASAMRLSFSLRLASDFDCAQGGRLPGMYGGYLGDAAAADGTNGFTSAFSWVNDKCHAEVTVVIPQGLLNPCTTDAVRINTTSAPLNRLPLSCNCTPMAELDEASGRTKRLPLESVELDEGGQFVAQLGDSFRVNGYVNKRVYTGCSARQTSLARGSFALVPGRWHDLEMHLRLNTVTQGGASAPPRVLRDGQLLVLVDGCVVARETQLVLRTTPGLQIDGLLFATFFGGSMGMGATPVDTSVYFANFDMTRIAANSSLKPLPMQEQLICRGSYFADSSAGSRSSGPALGLLGAGLILAVISMFRVFG